MESQDEPKKGGRPASRMPQDILDELGAAPDGLLERAEWASKVMGKVLELQLRGEIRPAYAASIRTSVATLARVTPQAAVSRVAEQMRREDAAITSTTSSGPKPVPAANAVPAIRRAT